MNLKKILGIGIPLTLSSIFGFGQKDTIFISNDSLPKITNIKYLGDSIILEKQYTLIEDEYKLTFEKSSNLKKGRLIYSSEIEYSYKSRPENVDYYDKKRLGPNFKGRIQEDKFEKNLLLTFYQYSDNGKIDHVKIKEKKGEKINTRMKYFLYREENGQEMRWEDLNNNGKFDEGDKMSIFMDGEWVELETKRK